MTDKQLEEYKKRVYEPYTEAWTIMKYMRDTEPKDDQYYEVCVKKCNDFSMKYNNDLGLHLAIVMGTSLNIIKEITKGAN
jgi:hypothetical protein